MSAVPLWAQASSRTSTGWVESLNFLLSAWRISLVSPTTLKFLYIPFLTSRLENPDTTEIGDLKGLNSNARVMIKLALYSAWARLQIASGEQKYLVSVVKPYTAMLTPLWLSSLQEYARLRFEPEISSTVGTVGHSGNLDDVYAALNRETLLTVSASKKFTCLSFLITKFLRSSIKTLG